jgi:hypothetical protein
MADVLIHRCTLRVVRRGGWSWGPSAKQLVDRLVRNVPALLARVLANLVPDDAQHEIAAPVRIRLPVRQADLNSLANSATPEWPAHDSTFSQALASTVEHALRDAVSANVGGCERDSQRHAAPVASEPEPSRAARRRRDSSGALPSILLRWHQMGVLHIHLAGASAEELEAWHAVLRTQSAEHAAPVPVDAATLAANLSAYVAARGMRYEASDHVSLLRWRTQLAIEAAAAFQLSSCEPALWRAVDAACPLGSSVVQQLSSLVSSGPQQQRSAPQGAATSTARPPNPGVTTLAMSPAAAIANPSTSWEVHISCALPFLLLGPLSLVHFFDAMSAALQSARVSDAGNLLAASLAYKVLDPPERGWLRSPSSLAAAAAFAGQQSAVDESQLVELARQLAPFTQLLDRINADTLFAGHSDGEPFLITRADAHNCHGYLLLDAQGCFPVFYSSDPSALSACLSRVARPVVLVARDASDPALLDALDHSGAAFIVNVNPARGERWNRIPLGAAAEAWTNHADPASVAIFRPTLQFTQAAEEGRAFWEQLGKSRVSAIRASSANLDRSMTLAAGTALGAIAWKLWSQRGRVTPQLVLERFGDLDAYVKFTEDVIVVRLPLGRRHRELYDHGLLAPVDNAFWFGDRRVEFAGG